MNECKCGRELRPGEKMCPSCESKKSHKWKTVAKVGGGIVAVVAVVSVAIFGGGDGDGEA